MEERHAELKSTTYEIFIGLISILSIVNLALYYLVPSEDVAMVVVIMDNLLTVILMADFLYRLFTAPSKADYFLRGFGWADFLASLPVPQLKLLRLFRIVRVSRLLHEYGPTGIVKEFVANRARSALLTLLLLVILLLEFGGMAILAVEQYAPDATIKTGSDAVWYTFVTITTVGYGDTFPVTNTGRLIGLLIMAVGVGLFGTLTGFLSNYFLGAGAEDETDQASGHENLEPLARDASIESSSGPSSGDKSELVRARAQLAEMKHLLAEQQASQAALARKIEEIEALL